MSSPGVLSEEYGYYNYQYPSASHRVRIVPSDNVDDSKVVEDVHVPSKTASIIEDISLGSDTTIIEGHASYENTSGVVDAIVESGTP